MGPLKKSDVKNHLLIRDRNGKRLYLVSSVADATGFSNDDAVRVSEKSFQRAFSPERLLTLAPILIATSSKRERE